MDAKKYLKTYHYGIDVNSEKPILITVKQLIELMNNFKKEKQEKYNPSYENRKCKK